MTLVVRIVEIFFTQRFVPASVDQDFRAYLRRGSRDAVGVARMEMLYRSLLILTFGGGTNEVQRDLIGMFGLGLPRMPRF